MVLAPLPAVVNIQGNAAKGMVAARRVRPSLVGRLVIGRVTTDAFGIVRWNVRSGPLRSFAIGRVVPRGVPARCRLVHARRASAAQAAVSIDTRQSTDEMLELAIGGNEAFTVSQLEIERGGVSYTVDTLDALRAEQPERNCTSCWAPTRSRTCRSARTRRICSLALPLVVRRGGIDEPDFNCLARLVSPARLTEIRQALVPMPHIELSSREIRRRVAGRPEHSISDTAGRRKVHRDEPFVPSLTQGRTMRVIVERDLAGVSRTAAQFVARLVPSPADLRAGTGHRRHAAGHVPS